MRLLPFLILIMFLTVFFSAVNASPSLSPHVIRWYVVYNPLPFKASKLVFLEAEYNYGEAYNGTLRLEDSVGNPIPFEMISEEFYGDSQYYRRVAVAAPLAVDGFSYMLVRLSAYGERRELETVSPMFNITARLVEASGDVVVENSFYRVVVSNSSRGLYSLVYKDLGNFSLVSEDWCTPSFSATLGDGTVVTQVDLTDAVMRVKLNSSLAIVIELLFRGRGFTASQTYTFYAFTDEIRVDYTVTFTNSSRPSYMYVNLFKMPIEHLQAVYGSTGESVMVSPNMLRSMTPAPRWIALGLAGKRYLVMYKYHAPLNFTALMERYLMETKELWPTSKAYRYLMGNLTAVFNETLATEMNVSAVTSAVKSLAMVKPWIASTLLKTMGDFKQAFNRTLFKRDIAIESGGYLFVASQVNETMFSSCNSINGTVIVSLKDGLNPYSLWMEYLSTPTALGVVELPLKADFYVPRETLVDEAVGLKAVFTPFKPLSNLTVTLELPEDFIVRTGNLTNYLLSLNSGEPVEIEWTVTPVKEGSYRAVFTIFLKDADYTVRVLEGINSTLPKPFPGEPRGLVNLTVICVDRGGRSLPNCLVKIYDNETGGLVASNLTDVDGVVTVYNLKVGIYKIEATDGLAKSSMVLQLYRNTVVKALLDKLSLSIKVTNPGGRPVDSVLVYVRDSQGLLRFAGLTNSNGTVKGYGLPAGNYTIVLRWKGVPVGSYSIQLTNDTELSFTAKVYRLVVKASYRGERLPAAEVLVSSTERYGMEEYAIADGEGLAVFELPEGIYEIKVSRGQYVGSTEIELRRDTVLEVKCEVTTNLWILMASTVSFWALYGFIWRRYTSVARQEREKYRGLLQRLEELWKEGLVDEKLYNKLRQEYEQKLREAGG